jgi:hypothetical protein
MVAFTPLDSVPAAATIGDQIPLALATLTASYPSADFDLVLSARRNGSAGAAADILALTFAGNPHAGTLDFTAKTKGDWGWSIRATQKSGTGSAIVEQGTLQLKADAASGDTAGHAERMLTAIEALLEGKAGKDVASYAIAGRSLTRMTVDELMKWRSHYRGEVRKLRAAAAGKSGKVITLARFS